MMVHLDIFVLTTIVSTLFISFMITVWREFKSMSEISYKKTKKEGPRAKIVDLIGSLMDDNTVSKIEVYQTLKRTIADMESDGIYFPSEIKRELHKQKNTL